MLLTLDDLSSSIERLSISPGGTRLAVANAETKGEVLVIDLPSGQPVAHYTGLTERPHATFRSETELLIAQDQDCWLCDLTSGSHRALPLPEKGSMPQWLSCCRASPVGTAVAMGGAKSLGLLILDLAGGNEPRLLGKGDGYIEGINYSPDGHVVALTLRTDEGERWWQLVRIIDAQSGEKVRDLKLPEIQGYVYATGFHPSHRILAVGWTSNVLLFDLHPPPSPLDPEVLFGSDWTGAPMGWAQPTACHPLGSERQGWPVEVEVLRFSADGSVLKVLCGNGEAVLMSTGDGQVLQRTLPPTDRSEGLFGADISPGGRAAVRVDDKTVLTWEVPGWGEA